MGDDYVEALGLGSLVDLGRGINGVSLDRSDATTAISVDLPNGTYSGIAGLTGSLAYVELFYSGSGNDSFDLRGDGHAHALDTGAGNDTIAIDEASTSTSIAAGAGADKLSIDDSADLYGLNIALYDANDPADPGGFTGSVYSYQYGSFQNFSGIEAFGVVKTGSGSDTLNFSPFVRALNLDAGDGNNTVYGGSGADSLTAGSGDDSISGGGGADTISAGAGADTLDGGAGIDKLVGGAGNDTYYVDNVKDQIVENAREGTLDTVYASSATYVLSANIEVLHYSGADTFIGTGNAQNNAIYADNATAATLHGAAGDDTLYGGAGNDSLYGEGGHDAMYGGGGNDYFRTLTGEGADTINGGGGFDLLTLERNDATVALKVDLTIVGNQAVGEGTVFQGIEQIRFAGGSGNDYERGGSSDDVLKGNGGDDTLIGGAGNDVLEGGNANDLTRTGLPDGHDSMTGGTGADTFRFDAPLIGADDTVTDFTTGVDKVALSKTGFGVASLSDFDIVNVTSGAFEHKAALVVDTVNHTISWDADGNGAGAAVLLAHGAFTTAPGDYVLF